MIWFFFFGFMIPSFLFGCYAIAGKRHPDSYNSRWAQKRILPYQLVQLAWNVVMALYSLATARWDWIALWGFCGLVNAWNVHHWWWNWRRIS